MFQPVSPLSVPVKFVNYEPPLKCELNKAESEESKKSVLNSEESEIPIVKKEIKIYRVKEKNIGLISKGKLEKKINDITGREKSKSPKRNSNGKQGIVKSNNYAYIQNAPRKIVLTVVILIILLLTAGRLRRRKLKCLVQTLEVD